jgi:GTP-binding protein EngB required for normal cell division
MNLQTLLESLRTERDNLDSAINLIESRMTIRSKAKKAKEIIETVGVKRQVHWSKKPGVDQKKLAKWKKLMAKQAKLARSSKNSKS